jgi:predicted nuclease of predicted toxin-antitoxin system
MRFLVNAQLPPALARHLAAVGHPADHVDDIGLGSASDSAIWNKALETGATIITKDEDFPRRLGQSQGGPVIVWLRIGNTSRRALIDWIDPLLPRIVALIAQGDSLIEVR